MILNDRLFFAQWVPPALAGFGGSLMAFVHLKQENYLIAGTHFLLWGLFCEYGAYLRDFLRKTSGYAITKLTPSWTSTLILELISSGILFRISEIHNSNTWLYFVLAINCTYLGAKYKCFVYRCCDVKFMNLRRYPFRNFRLPILEISFTIFILIVNILFLIFLPDISKTFIIVLFLCHILLRYACSLLRFANRKFLNSIVDYTILLPSIIFIILVW